MNRISSLFKSNLFLTVLTGLLLVLSWPPISFTPLLFVAFVPLLWVLKGLKKGLTAFLYSYLAFFIWTLGTMYWIANTRLDLQGFLTVSIAFVFIPFFQSFPVLLFHWLKRKGKVAYIWFLLPFFWITYEFLHSQWDLAFTWLHLGLGLTPMPGIIQFYEITGPLGGSLVVWLINIFVFLIAIYRRDKPVKNLSYGLGAFILLLAIANIILYPKVGKPKQTARIAIVQNSTDSYKTLNKETLQKQVELIRESVKTLKGDHIDLVVFPEGFLRTSPKAPLVLNNLKENRTIQALKEISQDIGAPILVGFIGFKLHNSTQQVPSNALPIGDGRFFSAYNGAMVISQENQTQIQLKNNLVPFMERVPFLDITSFFETLKLKLNQAKLSYGRDDKVNVFQHKQMKIAPLICLDAVFPDYTRHFIDKGANLVTIIANDGWAGKTSGYRQNAEYAKSVALSLRKNIVRAATTGISMFIDEAGNEEQSTKWQEQKLIIKEIELNRKKTFYSIIGDALGYISLIIITISFSYFFAKVKQT